MPGLEQTYVPRSEPILQLVSAEELLSSHSVEIPEVIGEGILPESGTMIFCGPSEVGKSLLTLEMAVRLANRMEVWGLPVPKARSVLIIQAEIPESREKIRLRKILKGLSLGTTGNIHFCNARLDLGRQEDVQALEDRIYESGLEVAILDPLSCYHSKDENDNAAMRGVLENLKNISPDLAWVVVHHHGRPLEGGRTRYRGASSIKDWCDTMVEVRAIGDCKVRLDFSKVRHGPKLPPILLERDENLYHYPVETGKVTGQMVLRALNDLGGSCQSMRPLAKKLMESTECGKTSAYKIIKNLIERGVIKMEGRGKKAVLKLKN